MRFDDKSPGIVTQSLERHQFRYPEKELASHDLALGAQVGSGSQGKTRDQIALDVLNHLGDIATPAQIQSMKQQFHLNQQQLKNSVQHPAGRQP